MRFFALTFLVLLGHFSLAQTDKDALPDQKLSTAERHGLDYELIGIADPQPELLNQIKIDQYEGYRQQSEDIQIIDAETGYTILLYSVDKVQLKKQQVSTTSSGSLELITMNYRVVYDSEEDIEAAINALKHENGVIEVYFDSSNNRIRLKYTSTTDENTLLQTFSNYNIETEPIPVIDLTQPSTITE